MAIPICSCQKLTSTDASQCRAPTVTVRPRVRQHNWPRVMPDPAAKQDASCWFVLLGRPQQGSVLIPPPPSAVHTRWYRVPQQYEERNRDNWPSSTSCSAFGAQLRCSYRRAAETSAQNTPHKGYSSRNQTQACINRSRSDRVLIFFVAHGKRQPATDQHFLYPTRPIGIHLFTAEKTPPKIDRIPLSVCPPPSTALRTGASSSAFSSRSPG